MSKDGKFREIEESHSQGIISEEEASEIKGEIGEGGEIGHGPLQEEKLEASKSKSSDKIVIIVIIAVIVIFGLIFAGILLSTEKPTSIDDLHKLNYKGKLSPDKGILYNGKYSFVKVGSDWYTQLQSSTGKTVFDLGFRFNPGEVVGIPVTGFLNLTLFNNAKDYYVTYNPIGDYDPEGESFSHIALAVGDFNQHMMKLYGKMPIAACDRNETETCQGRPIITCNSTQKVVLYFKEGNTGKVNVTGNCIIIEGEGFDLIKAVDRILFVFYNIMQP